MLRKLLLSVVIVLFANMVILAQSAGALKGKVKDLKTGEPIPFANIIVESGGQQVTGATTDFDGNYTIKPLTAGKYDVKATYVGYHPKLIQGVIISPNQTTYQDLEMNSALTDLPVVEIIEYAVPLIQQDQTQSGGTLTDKEISKMPGRDATSIAATVGGVYKEDGSDDMNIRGSRSESTVIYIDGVKVRGSSNVPKSAVDQVNVITAGLPAKYGDATGGVINITTKGPSKEFGGGIELVTSEFLDDYGYNLAAFSARGPLITKKLETRTASIVGFFISGEAKYERDTRPFHGGFMETNSDFLNTLEQNPYVSGISSTTNLRAEREATTGNFSRAYKKEDAAEQGINVAGKLDIKPAESNFNITLGGSIDYSNRRIYSVANSLFNSDNNGERIETTWRAYGRFTQRFNDPSAQKDEENEPLIKNVYYSIQVDYSKNKRIFQDESNEDNLFAYGHVAQMERQVGYNHVMEDNNGDGAYYFTGEYNQDGTPDTMYIRNAHIFTGFYDSANVALVNPSAYNPILGNYIYQYYYNIEGNTSSYNDISQGGGLLNGNLPRSVYSLYNSPGANYNYYGEFDNSQFSVSADGSADIGNHAIEFGLRYEQRVDRGFSSGQNTPSQLWTLMGQLTNKHNSSLDLANPYIRYFDVDTNGTIDTVIKYPFKYDQGSQSTFDINLRKKLNMPINGTGKQSYIDINNYDPSFYSLDMFSADELLNDGRSYVSYYGYDYTGDKLSSKPSFEDFFTEVDGNGNYTRPVGAYEPIYMSGYIQDKFEFEDLIFRLGLRVDRFDANQYVLKDPYLLYNSYTVGEKQSTIGDNIAVTHPGNIGNDYVIYVNNYENPTSIVGYRDGDDWYNAEGTLIEDVTTVRDLNPKPYVKNPTEVEGNPRVDAFEDYEPQTSFMPRIAFSFPVSDEANFYAHYDVITQRPMQNNRMDITDYYFIKNRSIGGTAFANPNLEPEKTINYQLGFQQKISHSSAFRIESYVKDVRDLQQIHYFVAAFPTPYYSYTNKDFGTVKGFTFAYDLRKTGNVWLKANYTLQFAEGTGSDENTSAALVRSGQPNLRTILPLDYDSRHSFNLIFDFRYGEGDDYNGPVWGSTQVLKNTGVNLTVQANSGNPYSKSSKIYSVYVNQGTNVLEGSINGSRMPWKYTVNAKIDRDIKIKFGKEDGKQKETYLNVYLEVLNLLDTKNVQDVYRGTGDPDDDGFLYDVESQDFIDSQIDTKVFRNLYSMRMANPYYFGFPRRIRLGVAFNF